MNPDLTIIIPTLNEERFILPLINHLKSKAKNPSKLELLVVDGGSRDETPKIAIEVGAKVLNGSRGRAKQQNFGAKSATAPVLYFLHADTFPPKHFDQHILESIQGGHESGCFRMKFDTQNIILRFFAWLTRFNHILCRGGDQSLYITKEKFEHLGGFDEKYFIYEDSEFIRRIYAETEFKIHKECVVTSARKYREKGWLKVQYHFAMIHLKNYLGKGPEDLYLYYKRNLLN